MATDRVPVVFSPLCQNGVPAAGSGGDKHVSSDLQDWQRELATKKKHETAIDSRALVGCWVGGLFVGVLMLSDLIPLSMRRRPCSLNAENQLTDTQVASIPSGPTDSFSSNRRQTFVSIWSVTAGTWLLIRANSPAADRRFSFEWNRANVSAPTSSWNEIERHQNCTSIGVLIF